MTYPGIGITRPNVARVYDYLLGGIESYTADREQATGLLRICPSLGVVALENRYLLARAVTWAAGRGLTQFIDLGAGMPVQEAAAGMRLRTSPKMKHACWARSMTARRSRSASTESGSVRSAALTATPRARARKIRERATTSGSSST